MEEQIIKLTSFSKSSGCGCKLSSADLQLIIGQQTDNSNFQKLLVGNDKSDDAAVFLIDEEKAIISTLDFFAPIVDSAITFGKIAATNAISDVYAMGGQPILATAILGWPIGKIPHHLAQEVMRGAKEICAEAGIPLAGGHSIESTEPFFGLSVNGLIHPDYIKKNNSIQEGDLIYLTKPIGTGILSSGLKRGLISEDQIGEAIKSMCTLNTIGAVVSKHPQVHAITDITGFGLLGHLSEMVSNTGFSIEMNTSKIPLLPHTKELMDQMVYPDITTKNYSHSHQYIGNLGFQEMMMMCDPQTSGGLLIAIAPEFQKSFEEMLVQNKIFDRCLSPIGKVKPRQDFEILLAE